MRRLHLKDREREAELNTASDGQFSTALQSLKDLFEKSATDKLTIHFGSDQMNLSATINKEDLEFAEWQKGQWNDFFEVPPPKNGYGHSRYLLEASIYDEHNSDVWQYIDVVSVHLMDDDLSKYTFYSYFNHKEINLGYLKGLGDELLSLKFKYWE